MSANPSALAVTYIRPGTRSMSFTLREVWHARELLFFLVWRDVKVRYKQTVLGIGWSVLQPFLTIFASAVLLGETIDPATFIAAALVIASIAMGRRAG